MKDRTGESSPTTGSVTTRALSLLDAFGPGRTSLTLSELAAHAGLPLSTTHRLAGDLTQWGALDRVDGCYQVGAKLRQIATNAPRGNLHRELFLPQLEVLAELTGYSALLAILEGTDLVYIEQVHGADTRFRPLVAQPPALAAAAGRVLAAFAPPYERGELLSRPVPKLTPYTETSPEALRRVLTQVRNDGYSVAARQVDVEHTVIATAIHGPFGNVVAALTLIVPFSTPDHRALIALCISASRTASRALAPRFQETYRGAQDSPITDLLH